VVDDHQEMRRAVSALLALRFELVGVARDGYEAIEMAERLAPDLILLDVMMPRLDGLQAAARLQELGLPARVVMMTSDESEGYVEQAFLAGAWGFLHKTRLATELVRALDHVHDGRLVLPSLSSLLTVGASDAHVAQFHSYNQHFIDGIGDLVSRALRRGHVIAVVATPTVRAGVAGRLRRAGWNVGEAGDYGRYHAIDAAQSLAGIMRGGRPDPERLGEGVAAFERMRVESAETPDARLTLVGEIAVPLLLNGNVQGAIEIERMWTGLTQGLPWLGVCCYPTACFADLTSSPPFFEVCAEHGAVSHAS
jgi:CheY-like chemotaxis protein